MARQKQAGAAVARGWPELALAEWVETRDTLHLWTQVVGKVRLALEPMVNHWWQVPLYVSTRGLTTSLMHAAGVDMEIEFDFVDHRLHMRTSTGEARQVALRQRSVTDFYAETTSALDSLGVHVKMLAKPVEIPDAIPFAKDDVHHSYDANAAQSFWLALTNVHRVMSRFRAGFTGKVSPVHFFWGGFDLAVTRFSGRTAPPHPGGAPHCGPEVMHEAYSHEVSSAGYWQGGGPEGSFYSYTYPDAPGYRDAPVRPTAAHWDADLGEFILPYEVVRTAEDPDAVLLEFLQTTYEAAADTAHWDRAALDAYGAPDAAPVHGRMSGSLLPGICVMERLTDPR